MNQEVEGLYGNSPDRYRPRRDKYLCARAYEALFSPLYGKRGEFVNKFYTYFRWFDDMVDSPDLPHEQRLKIIARQKELIEGKTTDGEMLPVERYYMQIPFDALSPGCQPLAKEQCYILAHSIEEDVRHFGLLPRTRREIRENNLRTFLPYAEVISLALNGHPIHPTKKFADFLDHWNYLGGLLHFPKDLKEERIIKVGFSRDEVLQIQSQETEEGRKAKILKIYDVKRYRSEWETALSGFRQTGIGFEQLPIPLYQKVISYTYLQIREPSRLPELFHKIENDLPLLQ